MRIGIKATQIVEGGGLKHFTMILDNFPRRAGIEYFVYLSESQQRFKLPPRNDVIYRFFRTPAMGPVHRLFWEQVILRQIIRHDHIDILFEPGNFGMIGGSTPRVLLIHNLAPFSAEFIEHEPLLSKLRLYLLRLVTRLSSRSAGGVIHLTEYAKDFVSDYLKIDDVPQSTIYMGSDMTQSATLPRSNLERVFGISGMLVFCCSHIYRYKNLMETVQAYSLLRQQTRAPSTLLIAGEQYDSRYTDEIRQFIDRNGLQTSVKLIGSVDSMTLNSLYAACDLFVFPSWLESASLILIEALQMGAPIAAANTGLAREVLDEAAVFFDPHDPQSICNMMKRVLQDSVFRDGLRRSARLRAKSFSWERTARETLNFILHAAGTRGIDLGIDTCHSDGSSSHEELEDSTDARR